MNKIQKFNNYWKENRENTYRRSDRILKDSGIDVIQEEAEQILDFLCMLTQLILNECFERDED